MMTQDERTRLQSWLRGCIRHAKGLARTWRPFILGVLLLSFGISWPVFMAASDADMCIRLVFAVMIFVGARFMRDYGYASAALDAWCEKYGQPNSTSPEKRPPRKNKR